MTDHHLIRVEGSDRTYHRLKVLSVLLLPLSMSLMALSSVNVALPTIEAALSASATDLQWILSGYALALGVVLIPAGRIGDVLGHGTWFIVGLAVFVAATIACGLAPTALLLNVARIAQGVGAGIFSPQITGMIQQYFDGAARAKAFAMFGLVISASVAVAPILTGFVIDAVGQETGWRWSFLIISPLGLAGLVLAFVWFPFETERRRRIHASGPTRLDLDPVGTLILVAAILCLMYPFMAHAAWAWALLPVAPLLAWLWVRWERRYASRGGEPMVDLHLFSFRSFRNGMLVSATMFTGLASTFAIAAIFLQSGVGIGALAAGLLGLPNAILSAFSSVWSVKYVLSHGRRLVVIVLWVMLAGVLLAIGAAVLIGQGAPWWLLSIPLALNGFAMGAFTSANQTLAMQDVPPLHGGTAGGIKQTVERIGAALGNAMVTGVFFALVGVGWTTAFAGAFGVVTLAVLVALVLAVMDQRQHRAA